MSKKCKGLKGCKLGALDGGRILAPPPERGPSSPQQPSAFPRFQYAPEALLPFDVAADWKVPAPARWECRDALIVRR